MALNGVLRAANHCVSVKEIPTSLSHLIRELGLIKFCLSWRSWHMLGGVNKTVGNTEVNVVLTGRKNVFFLKCWKWFKHS